MANAMCSPLTDSAYNTTMVNETDTNTAQGANLTTNQCFTLPDDPADMTGLPLLWNENPILQMSCHGGRPPHTLPPSAATFSRVSFPQVTLYETADHGPPPKPCRNDK